MQAKISFAKPAPYLIRIVAHAYDATSAPFPRSGKIGVYEPDGIKLIENFMKTGISGIGLFTKADKQIPRAPALLLSGQPQHKQLILLQGFQGIGEMDQAGSIAGDRHIIRRDAP